MNQEISEDVPFGAIIINNRVHTVDGGNPEPPGMYKTTGILFLPINRMRSFQLQ